MSEPPPSPPRQPMHQAPAPAPRPSSGLGLDPETLARLEDAGYATLDSMDEEDEERLARAADLTLDEAREIKRKVRRQLSQRSTYGR